MAKIEKLAPIISKWEGRYVNDPTDRGGATNMGITIGTWRQVGNDKDGDGDIDEHDIKLLNENDFKAVLRQYWNRWKADAIINQSIANILVDWVWGSGIYGIKIPQRLLGSKHLRSPFKIPERYCKKQSVSKKVYQRMEKQIGRF